MTARQQALNEAVQKALGDIRAELARDASRMRVGDERLFRLPATFSAGEGVHPSIAIRRSPEGFEWREYNARFQRKGQTAPAWRPL